MAEKKGNAYYIGLALAVIGIIELLVALGVFGPFQQWWLPIVLIIIGLMVLMGSKGITNILGWICLIYGAILILMTIGLFQIAFLWTISPIAWILFGLILIL